MLLFDAVLMGGGGFSVVLLTSAGGAGGTALLLLLGLLVLGGGLAARANHAVCLALTGTKEEGIPLDLAEEAADKSNDVIRRVEMPDGKGVEGGGAGGFATAAGNLGVELFAFGRRSVGILANTAESGQRYR